MPWFGARRSTLTTSPLRCREAKQSLKAKYAPGPSGRKLKEQPGWPRASPLSITISAFFNTSRYRFCQPKKRIFRGAEDAYPHMIAAIDDSPAGAATPLQEGGFKCESLPRQR